MKRADLRIAATRSQASADAIEASQSLTSRRHPRWTFHFIPTSSSWLNAVEGFFAKLTKRRLKHGVFFSLVELQAAIKRFIKEHNETEAKPFSWRADPTKSSQ